MPKVAAFSRVRERKTLRGRWKPPRARVRWRNLGPWLPLIGLAIAAVVILAAEFGPAAVGCDIKGNISLNTGERIYHVPGQAYYDATRINLLKGERWFCSEEAARKAGWRKARV